MLRFVLGKSGSGKTYELYKQIKNKIEEGSERIIMLIPDQISLETEKAVLTILGAPDKQKVNVFGFNKLCRFVYEQTQNPPKSIIDNGTRAVVMSRTLDDLDGKLRLLNSKNNKSLTALMLDALLECKKGCVTGEALRTAVSDGKINDNILRNKLLDTADIFDVFNGRLSQTHVDPLDDIDRVNEILISNSHIFNGYTVYIDAFSGFTAQQLRLVEYLIINCDEVVISLALDPLDISEEGVFSTSSKTFRILKNFAKKNDVRLLSPIKLMQSKRFKNDELRALESFVFRGFSAPKPYEKVPENIVLYPAADTYEECEFVAREIKKLIINHGCSYSDVAVITRDSGLYGGMINAVFDKYKIPYFLDEHKDIDVKPIARAINSVFRIILDNFERADVIMLLKSGLLEFTDAQIRDFEDYIFVWNIDNSGFKSEFIHNSNGFGEALIEDKKRENAEEVRKTIVNTLLKFKNDIKDCTAGELTERLYRLLTEDLKIKSGIERLCGRLKNGLSPELSGEQIKIWELFVKALEKLRDVIGAERLSIRRYYELLSLQLSAIEFAEIPQYLDSVIITNAQRLRDPHYKAVFLIGCTDGSFPANPESQGLFSDYELQMLSENDLHINENPLEFVSLEIFMAYNCMVSASDKLFVCYPKLAFSNASEESSGTVLKPSQIVTELKKAFPLLEPTLNTSINPYEEMMVNKETAFEAYSLSLSDSSVDLSSLREIFANDPNYAPRLEAVENAVNHQPFEIKSKESANAIFGSVLESSASRIQTYYQCPFRYFCSYGLNINERLRAEINPIERGNLIHKVLESFFKTYSAKTAYSVLTNEDIKNFVDSTFKSYLDDYMGGVADKTGAFQFQLEQIKEKTVKVIRYIAEEITNSEFDVEDTELDFPKDMLGYRYILPDGHEICVRGKVDRVDSSVQNGEKFIRIIDYKSKTVSKGFSLAQAYYGIDLQMLIYMIAITRNGSDRYGDFRPGGVLYSNVLFGGFSENDVKKKSVEELIRDEFKLKGLYIDEKKFSVADKANFNSRSSTKVTSEELDTIFKKVDLLVKEMGENLYNGKIPAQCLKSGSSTTCEFCSYEDVCSYNMSEPKIDEFSVVKKDKKQRILNKMKEDLNFVNGVNEIEVNGGE